MRIDVDGFGFCFVLFGWPGRTRRLALPFGSSQDDRGSVRLSRASAKIRPGPSDRSVDVCAQTCLGDRRAGRTDRLAGARVRTTVPPGLGGALEELSRIVSEFDAEVRGQNLTRAEGLKRLEDNDDPLAHERGEDMGKAIERAKRLNEQIQAMNSAGPLMRLYVITKGFDPAIARSTLDNYEPAGPLSLGALTSGGLAALWGWAATRLIAWPFSRRSGLRAARA
jgi:Protein of unknown function (DUF2937)